MDLDLMVGPMPWSRAAELARDAEAAGFAGMLFTETSQTPWMSIAAAATATSRLMFTTGIAVAFPRSPMIAASIAWELAENTKGRFRLGLGSQVKAHVERRYGAAFDPPGPRMRDYLLAVKACLRAFRGDEPLAYHGEFYDLTLLPAQWAPPKHEYGDVKVDVSAVGPWMSRMAGEVADGVHVHPLHSPTYLQNRLLPALGDNDVDLIIPVFAIPADSPNRDALVDMARMQIGFYGSTRNYAFQFDDLGFEGTSARMNEKLKAGDIPGLMAIVTDDMLEHFSVIAPWDELADRLRDRYGAIATRVVSYLAHASIGMDASNMARWGEVAKALSS